MNTSEILNLLTEKYNCRFTGISKYSEITLPDGTVAAIRVKSIGNNVGGRKNADGQILKPFFQAGKELEEIISNLKNGKPTYLICGDSDSDGTPHFIKIALNECASKQSKEDYILAVEPVKLFSDADGKKCLSYYGGVDIKGLLGQAEKNPEAGIYRQHATENGNSCDFILVRVKEKDGTPTKRYLDAYFAASDPRTFKGVKYEIAQYQRNDAVVTTAENDPNWPHNLLIFGAPGTGKSYCIKKKLAELGDSCRWERVTFYEDYSYEKFIGAFLPTNGEKAAKLKGTFDGKDLTAASAGEGIQYTFVPGVLLKLIADAWMHGEKKHVLVIEEINRANAASVFGDFFQLLDRGSDGVSEYSISLSEDMRAWLREYVSEQTGVDFGDYEEKLEEWLDDFRLTKNIYLWATMNSADQGVYPMDAAFKRRWSYRYMSAQDNGSSENAASVIWKKNGEEKKKYLVEWDVLKAAFNKALENSGNIEEDRFIGPWYFKSLELQQMFEFMKAEDAPARAKLSDPMTDKLLQYLRQDVFRNNPGEIFKDGYQTLSGLRQAMRNGEALNDILKIELEDEDDALVELPLSLDGKEIKDFTYEDAQSILGKVRNSAGTADANASDSRDKE